MLLWYLWQNGLKLLSHVMVAFQGPWLQGWHPCHTLVRVTKVHQQRLLDQLHSVFGPDHGSPLIRMLGEKGVSAVSPTPHTPAHARYVILFQLLQYLPLPISNTPWTSKMACCEQTCLLSTQEFPGFVLRQARRFPPGDPETAVLVLLCAEFPAFHGSL